MGWLDSSEGNAALGIFGGLGAQSEYNRYKNSKKPIFQQDPGPRPVMPEFQSLRDPSTGLLANDNYRLNWGDDIMADQRAIEQLRSQALAAPGESAWEKMALQKQGLQEAQARTDAGTNAAAAAAQARSTLASRRGLSSGAGERLAASSLKDAILSRQNVGAQGAQARADIGLQAEQMRRSDLNNLTGQELAYLQPQFQNRQGDLATQQFNIGEALRDKYAEDRAKQVEYQEQMKAWAAINQANAIAASGGGGKKGGGGGGGGGGGKK